MEEHIRANVELVLHQLRLLSALDFGYTEESVKWLDGYIERLRNSGEFDNLESRQPAGTSPKEAIVESMVKTVRAIIPACRRNRGTIRLASE